MTIGSCFLSSSFNSVQRLQRRCRKCLSKSEARVAIFFLIGPRNTNLVEDVSCDLASCQVSLNYVQPLQRKSRKCVEKLTTTHGRSTDRRTDDGQCMLIIVHLSLRLMCTLKSWDPPPLHYPLCKFLRVYIAVTM